MDKKPVISKITIRIGDKETPLTIEQARELKDALLDLLGEEKVVERAVYPTWHWYAYPQPYRVSPNWTVTTTYGGVSGTTYNLCMNTGG